MEIVKVRVQNYKSIVDSGEVNIDPKLTVLIGKNEQGKSNFLQALKSFNADYKYLPSDLTNHLRPLLEEKPSKDVPMVTLWLRLNSDDLEQLGKINGNISNVEYMKVVKFYGNNYNFTIIDARNKENVIMYKPLEIAEQVEKLKSTVTELNTKLTTHATRHPEFGKNKEKFEQLVNSFLNAGFSDTAQIENLVKTLCTGIRGVPGQDKPIQDDIANTTKRLEVVLQEINKLLSEDVEKHLIKIVPKFILHIYPLDKIPNEVNIVQFITAPEQVSKGMLNLCRAAGLSIQKIQELAKMKEAYQREVYEDHYKGYISGGINEFWTQEDYAVHFRIESDKLSVSISDGTYSHRLPPSERSDGFQWLLSFYSRIQNECASSAPIVILLDNPALELHVDGQRDIKRFLEEKITSNTQVIYVTHSPAMVDPLKMKQIRTVELISETEGTKISNKIIKEGEHLDILEPLRSAIGSSIGYSLLAANYNILVEGMADKFLIEGVLYRFRPEIRDSFIVNGSLAESKECILARVYKGLGLPFVAVLDADSKGREIAGRLGTYGIEENNIIETSKLFHDKEGEFTVVDLVSPEMYHQAVKRAYPEKMIEKPEQRGSKIEKTYEDEFKDKFGIGFSKVRVSQALKKMLMENRKIDSVTKANLEKLAREIHTKLTDIG